MGILATFMVPHPPMIIPEIGKGAEQQITETIAAYEQVADEIAALQPETIIISSPHSILYSDYFHISPGAGAKGSFAEFGVPEVNFEETYDEALRDLICKKADAYGVAAGKLGEKDPALDHGTMVPLWFIRHKYQRGNIIRIGLSGLGLLYHYRLGEIAREAADQLGRRVVWVASGDLSHKLQEYGPYGFAQEGPEYDRRVLEVAERAAFDEWFDFDDDFCVKAAECGHKSFVMMAGALDGMAVKAKVYAHQDVTGVGYGIASFYPMGEDENRHFRFKFINQLRSFFLNPINEKETNAKQDILKSDIAKKWNDATDPYVKLAQLSIAHYLLTGKELIVSEDELLPEMVQKEAGTFVSIHKFGKLRGCIGTFLPTTKCIAQEIIQNAIHAATLDPRFNAISPEELKDLEIHVDVLSEPEPVQSTDQLDAKRYGVIVSSGKKRGLLLPDLEGVDTVEQQVAIAMQKGGIDSSETVQLQRFEVIRHQ
ncbi:MAG: AmmeMemoRadiSam system protein A [Lachnospiraceae bacterium]|nr:AmmeMemoRadiSam system protein A [Lachnospiraceae bacterium]